MFVWALFFFNGTLFILKVISTEGRALGTNRTFSEQMKKQDRFFQSKQQPLKQNPSKSSSSNYLISIALVLVKGCPKGPPPAALWLSDSSRPEASAQPGDPGSSIADPCTQLLLLSYLQVQPAARLSMHPRDTHRTLTQPSQRHT